MLLATVASGCGELRARRYAREGNHQYIEGNWAAAVKEYSAAEQLKPNLPAIVLNKGLACRQLMLPGARTPETERAVQCALAAFERLKQLSPNDPRGDQLYVQTLFDADRFETLVGIYQQQLQANPRNMGAINGLVQVYSRWGEDHWEDAAHWMARRAELQEHDAEAHYAVGVFIWNRLYQKGGGGERATFDPRPEAKAVAPPIAEGEIMGEERIRLADRGIALLQKALEIRPTYREAMTYLNLLYRQKSYAFFDRPEEWQALTNQAEMWRNKAMQAGGPSSGGAGSGGASNGGASGASNGGASDASNGGAANGGVSAGGASNRGASSKGARR